MDQGTSSTGKQRATESITEKEGDYIHLYDDQDDNARIIKVFSETGPPSNDSLFAKIGEIVGESRFSRTPATPRPPKPVLSGYRGSYSDSYIRMATRRIFEEGSPISPAYRSVYSDVEVGRGRYSHYQTPPPLELPPLEAYDDDSFNQWVSNIVNRYPRSSNHNVDTGSYNNSDCDDENQVELARRDFNEALNDEDNPFIDLFSFNKSKSPEQAYVMLDRNPRTVNDLKYIPADEEEEKTISDPALKLSVKKNINDDAGLQSATADDDDSISEFELKKKDFCSWLCFDDQEEFLNFNDNIDKIIANINHEPHGKSKMHSGSEKSEFLLDKTKELHEKTTTADDNYKPKESSDNAFDIEAIFGDVFGKDSRISYKQKNLDDHLLNSSTTKADISSKSTRDPAQKSTHDENEDIVVGSSSPNKGKLTTTGAIKRVTRQQKRLMDNDVNASGESSSTSGGKLFDYRRRTKRSIELKLPEPSSFSSSSSNDNDKNKSK